MFKMLLTSMVLMFEWMQNLYERVRHPAEAMTERIPADKIAEPRRTKIFQSNSKIKKDDLDNQPYPSHPQVLRSNNEEQNLGEKYVDAEKEAEAQFLSQAKKVGSIDAVEKERDDDDEDCGVVLLTDPICKGSLYRCCDSLCNNEMNDSNSLLKKAPLKVKPEDDLEPLEEEEAEDKSREEAEVPTVTLSQDKEEVEKLEACGKETANADDASSDEYYVEVPSNMTKAVQVEDAAQLNLTEDPTAFPFDPGELVENEAKFPADEFFDEISEVTDPVDLPDQELGKPRL